MSKRTTKKLKWTHQMNKDVLDCKRKALEMVESDNPPRKDDGRKKGYIELMKQLWDESGYLYLGIKAQNLRDQAARLEKCQESPDNTTLEESLLEKSSRNTQTLTGFENYNIGTNQNNDNNGSQVSTPDLHTPTAVQVPEEQPVEERDEINKILSTEMPGSLPEFTPVQTPHSIV